MQPHTLETGSSGFVWQNLTPDEIFSRVQFHVYTAFEMHTNERWAGSQFVNHYNRIYFVKSGEAELVFKHKTMLMKPGHLYLIPPYQLLSHQCSGDLHFMWTHFQAKLDDAIDLFMFYGEAMMIDCAALAHIEDHFLDLIEAIKDKSVSAIFERNRLLLNLLSPFFSTFEKDNQKVMPFRHTDLLPAFELLNNNIANPPDISELAEMMGFSKEHFSRKFKAAFNISPKRYLSKKRIDLAKQYLLLDNDLIDNIAAKCGFCDIYHFSRIFKQEVGVSPSVFRREYDLSRVPNQQ